MASCGRFYIQHKTNGSSMYVKNFKKSSRKIALSPVRKEAACYPCWFEAEDAGFQIEEIFQLEMEIFTESFAGSRTGEKQFSNKAGTG